jgi:S-DNA-T family DNA segregation ATPase FtsK/SpoIIIE
MAARSGTVSRGRSRAQSERTRLLPEGTGDFVRRRAVEGVSLALLILGLAVLVAGLSYNPADPSFNRAVPGPVHNLLGWPGAAASDFALHSLGLSVFLAPLILFAWAWRLWQGRGLPRWVLRLLGTGVVVILAAVALAGVPVPRADGFAWPLGTGLGGFIGSLGLNEILIAVPQAAPWMAASAAAVLAIALFLAVAGLTRGEWQALGMALAWPFMRIARALVPFGSGALHRAAQGARGLSRVRLSVDSPNRREPALSRSSEVDATRTAPAQPVLRADPRTDQRTGPRAADPRDLVAAPKAPLKPGKRAQQAKQRRFKFSDGGYELPPLSVLTAAPADTSGLALNRDALAKNARLLETVLDDFGVRGEIVKVRPGPVVTRYELEPAPGTKTSRVVGLADDIARSMSAISVRVAVVPGSSAIGIELPNAKRATVYLRELLDSQTYERSGFKLPLVLGKDIGGAPSIVDLARMPHLLIAGTTGSGKSVGLNSMILSLLYRLGPDQCKFIMIDPKMLELSVYDGIPHLLSPVVTEPKKAVVALKWTVREMEERYRAMSRLGVRNVEGYNSRIEQALKSGEVLTRKVQTGFDPDTGQPIVEEQPFDLEPLPFIVVVVDEMADLMLVAGKDIEMAVQRLAQMARAAGIHLIMATQRPSVDVITGTIKANFPTRISFHVTSKIDSRTILGEQGAEQLLGQGDMLYMAHGGRIARVHGPLVTDGEVEDVVAFLKEQAAPDYIEGLTEEDEAEFDPMNAGGAGEGDELYDRAVAVVHQHRKASTSFIQRHLQIGYNRAARIVERMEAEGVVSEANHVGKREVLLPGGDR